MVPEREIDVVAFEVDAPVVVNGHDLHGDDRLVGFVGFLVLDPVHEMSGSIRAAGSVLRHGSAPDVSGPYEEALLPAPVGAGRVVIRATHERGVGVPPSRSLATASHDAPQG